MTDSSTKPSTYILRLSFDANQITQTLQYKFFTESGLPCDEETSGPLAGTFNFQDGDELQVQVVASAEADKDTGRIPELQVNITNCTFVSIKPPVKQDLSLFDPYNACTTISEWSLPETVIDPSAKSVSVTTTALKNLIVTAKTGQWKISGYLSVITGEDSKEQKKLYFFDPEGSAGTGGGFGGG